MQVFKCDRCGDIYEPYKNAALTPKYSVKKHIFPVDEFEVDLCPKCCALLEKFMEKEMMKGE